MLNAGGDIIVPHLHPMSKAVLRNRLSYAIAIKTGLVSKAFSYRDFYEFICYSSGVRPDAYLRTATGVLEHDALDYWERLDTPTLFLAAENDLIVPAQECRSASARLPQGQYSEIKSASHAGMVEAGKQLAQAIQLFIDAHMVGKESTVFNDRVIQVPPSQQRPHRSHHVWSGIVDRFVHSPTT